MCVCVGGGGGGGGKGGGGGAEETFKEAGKSLTSQTEDVS